MQIPINILVLCTGNSARSILGEVLLNSLGAGRVRAFSAGSQPKGVVHPGALRLLQARGFDTGPLSSKSWDLFTADSAPAIDLVITVCSSAAGETCPLFPGSPMKAHWGIADPAATTGPDAAIDASFAEAWRLLEMRVRAFLALDLETMGDADVRAALSTIGAMEGAA